MLDSFTNWLLSCQAHNEPQRCCLLKESKCRFVTFISVEGFECLNGESVEAVVAGTWKAAIGIPLDVSLGKHNAR